MGSHSLLQGIFLTQGSNSHLLRWQADSLSLHHLGGEGGGSQVGCVVAEQREDSGQGEGKKTWCGASDSKTKK